MIVLALICIALGRIQEGARRAGRPDAISQAIQSAVSPAASSIQIGLDAVTDFGQGIFQARSLRAENQALRRQLAALQLYDVRVQSLNNEIRGLREQLRVSNFGARPLRGSIVGFFPFENRLTLDVGAAQGVKTGQAVVALEGLLAIVQTVGPNSCQALLITSPAQRVGAQIEGDPPAVGILRGESERRARLEFLDSRSQIKIGDWVVTSGFSAVIPRGIPIGRVAEVRDEPDFGTRRVAVSPIARVGRTREVTILR